MLKYNPFRPNSIVRPGMFKGRYGEVSNIQQSLIQAKNGNASHFAILGERGIGKSSLLFLIEKLCSGQLPLFDGSKLNFLVLSMELESSDDNLGVIRKIGQCLRSSISELQKAKSSLNDIWTFLKGWEILGVKYNSQFENMDVHEATNQLAKALRDIIKTKEVEGIALLIDEADRPPATANLGENIKLLTERLSKYDCDKVLIGLAGQQDLIEKLRSSHESSPRLFQVLDLQPLTYQERIEVLDAGISEANADGKSSVLFTDEAKNEIAALSEGYPHFLQQFAFCAFAEDSDNKIDTEDVNKSIFSESGALEQLGQMYFKDLYLNKIGSDDYRKVLQCMAQSMDEWVSRPDILEKTGLKEHTLTNAVRALKQRGVILSKDGSKGVYRLPTKSFAVWIKAYSANAHVL